MPVVSVRNVRMLVLDRVVAMRMCMGFDHGAVVVVAMMFVVNV